MTKLKPSHPTAAIFLIVWLCLAASTFAAPQGKIAEVENQGTVLVFYPFVEYDALTLTVSGPCDYRHRAVFDRGETPYWEIEEDLTIDGVYTYELQTRPVVASSLVETLQLARRNFDEETPKRLCREGRLPAAPQVQAQAFTVADFEILYDPTSSDEGLSSPTGKSFELEGLDTGDTGASRLGGYFADPAAKDEVINNDLIVDGSACIGTECADGESFGFDTLRFKENNLRVRFDDTSSPGPFPNNDWQLIINDSSSGGANKFALDDITGGRTPFTVEAGAPNHSLFVDDIGRLGNGTSAPAAEIHSIDGDTPTLRLEQDGSSGFTPQIWDISGNETNFSIRNATTTNLPFRIRAGAPTSAMDIATNGDIGFGTSSPSFNLHIVDNGSTATRDLLRLENNGTTRISLLDTSTNDEWQFANNGGANAFVITAQGSGDLEFSLNRADATSNPGRLTITGDIVTGGGTCGSGCDALFQGEIESIEEHAESMWTNSYLPAVGPTSPNEPWNLTEKVSGMLAELEKAHIYIDQLNNQLAGVDELHSELAKKDRRIADLEDRLATIEALLSAQND